MCTLWALPANRISCHGILVRLDITNVIDHHIQCDNSELEKLFQPSNLFKLHSSVHKVSFFVVQNHSHLQQLFRGIPAVKPECAFCIQKLEDEPAKNTQMLFSLVTAA